MWSGAIMSPGPSMLASPGPYSPGLYGASMSFSSSFDSSQVAAYQGALPPRMFSATDRSMDSCASYVTHDTGITTGGPKKTKKKDQRKNRSLIQRKGGGRKAGKSSRSASPAEGGMIVPVEQAGNAEFEAVRSAVAIAALIYMQAAVETQGDVQDKDEESCSSETDAEQAERFFFEDCEEGDELAHSPSGGTHFDPCIATGLVYCEVQDDLEYPRLPYSSLCPPLADDPFE